MNSQCETSGPERRATRVQASTAPRRSPVDHFGEDQEVEDLDVERGSGSLGAEERIEVERFSNEAVCHLRAGVPWREAWRRANADAGELRPEEPPVNLYADKPWLSRVHEATPLEELEVGSPALISQAPGRPAPGLPEDAGTLYPGRTTPVGAAGVMGGRARIHPAPAVGDVFGNVRVVDVLGRGWRGRADLRVRVECLTCGRRADGYEFNVRKGSGCAGRASCPKTSGQSAVPPPRSADEVPSRAAEGPKSRASITPAASPEKGTRMASKEGAAKGFEAFVAEKRKSEDELRDRCLDVLRERGPIALREVAEAVGQKPHVTLRALRRGQTAGLAAPSGRARAAVWALTGNAAARSIADVARKAARRADAAPARAERTPRPRAPRASDDAAGAGGWLDALRAERDRLLAKVERMNALLDEFAEAT